MVEHLPSVCEASYPALSTNKTKQPPHYKASKQIKPNKPKSKSQKGLWWRHVTLKALEERSEFTSPKPLPVPVSSSVKRARFSLCGPVLVCGGSSGGQSTEFMGPRTGALLTLWERTDKSRQAAVWNRFWR